MFGSRLAEHSRTASSDAYRTNAPPVRTVRSKARRPRTRWVSIVIGLLAALTLWFRRCARAAKESWKSATSSKLDVAGILRRVENGTHRRFDREEGILGVMARVVTFRGSSKAGAISSACRAAKDLIECNPELASRDIDVVIAALITAKANPPDGRSSWVRPSKWGPCGTKSAGKLGGVLTTAVSDLGYHSTAWPAVAAVRRNLGCSAPSTPSAPIFAWEIGGPSISGSNIWEKCVLAWGTFLCISGARPGTMSALRMGHVTRIEGQCVWIVFPTDNLDDNSDDSEAHQFKDERRTAMRRPARVRGLILDNWRMAKYFIPWVSLLRFLKFGARDRVFPSMVDARRCRNKTAPIIEGFRVMSDRAIDARGRARGLDFLLGTRVEGRTPHGFRHGQTVEFSALGVTSVVRFRCQLRSLVPILGSEAAYDRVDEDAARRATRSLGSRRIIQGPVGMSVTATSSSQGRFNDWVQRTAPEEIVEPISAFVCQRCGDDVNDSDEEGVLCDTDGCVWGLCGVCHPDPDTPLSCPQHQRR